MPLKVFKQEFIVVEKYIIFDKDISFGAKGLYCYLCESKEETIKIDDLKKVSKNGQESTRTYILELERKGYIARVRR